MDPDDLTEVVGDIEVFGGCACGNGEIDVDPFVEDLLALVEVGNLLAVEAVDAQGVMAGRNAGRGLLGGVVDAILDLEETNFALADVGSEGDEARGDWLAFEGDFAGKLSEFGLGRAAADNYRQQNERHS